jgi:membrane associated rhomboid family serine protease
MAGEAWAWARSRPLDGFRAGGQDLGRDDARLGRSTRRFRQGFWWTPLTHIFLHAGLLHIVMNTRPGLGPAIAVRLGRDLKGALLFWAFF